MSSFSYYTDSNTVIRTAVTAEVILEESKWATQLSQNHHPRHIIFTKLHHSLKFYSLGIDVGEGE